MEIIKALKSIKTINLKTMKKVFLLFVAIIGFAAISNNLLAQTNTKAEKAVVTTEQSVTTPGNFLDKDKNGVCDKYESKSKTGKGANFVDKNGDGVCDKHLQKGNKNAKCNGTGKGNGKGNCCGNHKGFGNGNCYRQGQTK